jgi:hypothetical protein
MNLAQAIKQIEQQYGKQVSGIMYEDGSGYKFVVSFVGDTKQYFVKL